LQVPRKILLSCRQEKLLKGGGESPSLIDVHKAIRRGPVYAGGNGFSDAKPMAATAAQRAGTIQQVLLGKLACATDSNLV
jgi:hypothetical protein